MPAALPAADVVTASRELQALVPQGGDGEEEEEDPNKFDPPGRNTTIFAKLEASPYFQNATLTVIVINAFWIFIDVEWNHNSLADSDGRLPLMPVSTAVENTFCLYFTCELVVRFIAFRRKRCCFRDAWFVFDGFLVALMVLETWAMPVMEMYSGTESTSGGALSSFSSFRLLRLLRLTRMARIMRFFPALMVLVKGMMRAMSAVFWILLFLVIVMYLFAILFTVQLGKPSGGEEEGALRMFASIGSSMMTLFTNGVLGDNLASTLEEIKVESMLLMWVFIIFMIISSLTLLNMLIGVLCEVVQTTADEEEDTFREMEVRRLFEDAFKAIDSSGDGQITRKEWDKLKDSDRVWECLQLLGVKDGAKEDTLRHLQESLFGVGSGVSSQTGLSSHGFAMDAAEEETALALPEFVAKVIELRFDVPAGSLELQGLKTTAAEFNEELKGRLADIDERVAKILEEEAELSELEDEVDGETAPTHEPESTPEPREGGVRLVDSPSRIAWDEVADDQKLLEKDNMLGSCLNAIPTPLLLHTLEGR